MTVTFTLNSIYLGTEAGPFNISGTTGSNVTTELTTNLSLQDLTSGHTISGIDDNTTGFTIQSVGTCINYVIKPVNSCNCPDGYTASVDGSICYRVTSTSPTTNDTLLPEAGQDNSAYGEYGVKIYNYGDYDSTGNSVSGDLAFSGFTNTFDGSSTTSVEGFYAGRMNANNVWVAGDANWPGPNYPDFISFCATFTLSQNKIYYVGIAGDNDVTIKLNGVELVNQADNSPQSNFKFWHVYPVLLNAGPNIIELENWNRSSVGSFAAEIYDNTINEMTVATSTEVLNVVFATGDYLPGGSKEGQGFCSNYTCPTGYSLDVSNPQNPICKLIETTNCQSGQVRQYAMLNVEHLLSSESCSATSTEYQTLSVYVLGDSIGVGTIMYYDSQLTMPYMNSNEGYWVQITDVWSGLGLKYTISTNLTNGEIVDIIECSPTPTPTPTNVSSNTSSANYGTSRANSCNPMMINTVNVYFTALNWDSLQVADILYSDNTLTTPVSDGYYYNNSATTGMEVVTISGGAITVISDCAGNIL
jgi:hypothetical protein